jgi:hypothetical protein
MNREGRNTPRGWICIRRDFKNHVSTGGRRKEQKITLARIRRHGTQIESENRQHDLYFLARAWAYENPYAGETGDIQEHTPILPSVVWSTP